MCSFSIKFYIYNYIYLSPSLFLYLPIYPSYLSFNLSLFHALTPFTLFVSLCLSLSLAHFHWSGHQLYHLVVDMLCPPTATLLTYYSPPPPFSRLEEADTRSQPGLRSSNPAACCYPRRPSPVPTGSLEPRPAQDDGCGPSSPAHTTDCAVPGGMLDIFIVFNS